MSWRARASVVLASSGPGVFGLVALLVVALRSAPEVLARPLLPRGKERA